MARKRLLVVGLVGALVVATMGVLAAPPPTPKPPAEPVPFVKVLALTLQEIAEGIGTLHKALPMIAPRLEPIQGILKGLYEAAKEPAEIELKDVQVELIKLDLLLHRLLFDLEREARQLAEFRESVKQFVGRFTQGMEPRLAERFHQFAQELIEIVQERLGEKAPGAANPEELGRAVGRLKAAVARLDLLLLQSLEPKPAGISRRASFSDVPGTMHAVRLITARLTIAACPLEVAQSLVGDRRGLKEILGARLPPDWPCPELAAILPLYVQELLHDPATLGWGVWIALPTEQNVVVGAAGFKGRPDRSGTVEIGYEVAPAFRRQGYATEAVQALVGWALAHPEVKRVVAECAPDNTASIRVLEKTGFRQTRSDPRSLFWENVRQNGSLPR